MGIPKLKIANVNGANLIAGDDGMGLLGMEQLADVIRRAEAYEGLVSAIETVVGRIDYKDPDSSCCCQNSCQIKYCNNMAILQQALGEQK